MQTNRSLIKAETKISPTNRRGGVLVAALVCLGIVSLVLLSVFKSAISQRKQLRLEAQQVQAELLARSGLDRAVVKLAQDVDYSGEEWQITTKDLGGRHAASVEITIQKTKEHRLLTAVALFPKDSRLPNRATQTIKLAEQVPAVKASSEPTKAEPATSADDATEEQPKTDKPKTDETKSKPTKAGAAKAVQPDTDDKKTNVNKTEKESK